MPTGVAVDEVIAAADQAPAQKPNGVQCIAPREGRQCKDWPTDLILLKVPAQVSPLLLALLALVGSGATGPLSPGLAAPPAAAQSKAAQAKPAGAKTAARPNVLLIVGDDIGLADTGPYGSEIDTPHLNELAAEGVRFTNSHVSPVCSVTRG